MATVLFDVDGVICDLHTTWLELYNVAYQDTMTLEDITRWEIHEVVKPECGKKIYEFLHQPDLYDRVLPIQGALAAVNITRNMGHRVIFVTSCEGPEMTKSKTAWMFNHRFLEAPVFAGMRDLVIMRDKSLIKGDLLVEDYPENLFAFGGKGILVTRPYNRSADLTGRPILRADKIVDVPFLIQQVLS